MKKICTILLLMGFASMVDGCCSKEVAEKAPQNFLHDVQTFKATKAILDVMQKNLDKKGRKNGIHVEFGNRTTRQGIVVHFYSTSFNFKFLVGSVPIYSSEIPKTLQTPWGNFFQDTYRNQADVSGLKVKEVRLPKWRCGDKGDYYAITEVNDIQLPMPGERESGTLRDTKEEKAYKEKLRAALLGPIPVQAVADVIIEYVHPKGRFKDAWDQLEARFNEEENRKK